MKFRLLAALLLFLPFDVSPALAQSAASPRAGTIERIEFDGLRRIFPAALRAQISSREGQALDPARIEKDVRALDRLGWFDTIAVEVVSLDTEASQPVHRHSERSPPQADAAKNLSEGLVGTALAPPALRLVFHLTERPFLVGVEFRGSRALPQERISALLAANGIRLKQAAPADRGALWRTARTIEAELAHRGHPRAEVRLRLDEQPGASVRATFEIRDGPHILVSRVAFTGNQGFSERKLRRQMKGIAPRALFAGLREKNIYTPERLSEDLERVQSFYRNHGYAEARLGVPRIAVVAGSFRITIPVEEGAFYRLAAVEVEGATPPARTALGSALRGLGPQAPYSEEALERARKALARLSAEQAEPGMRPTVEVLPQFDRSAGSVRVTLRVREADAYTVRRIEFLGHHRFRDSYYRRRIALKEGEAFDPDRLERGLDRLARSGFIKPVTRRDVRVNLDPAGRAADVTIRFEEIGRQRFSLVGGSGQFSTIGIVYNLFDLFGGEELLTTHIEGGPESLNLLLGVAKEGVFGTRASLGLSVFRNVIRPRVQTATGRQQLFTTASSGLGLGWEEPLTPRDTLGAKYELSQSLTRINLGAPPTFSGLRAAESRTRESSHAVKLSWGHNDGASRLEASSSVSGGLLGGDEQLLSSSLAYSRVLADPLTDARNSWALRGHLEGVSAYGRQPLPLQDRLFAGPQLLRGFRTGELGPYAVAQTTTGNAGPAFRAQPAGADLMAAANGEYRVPLDRRLEAAGFLDLGTGWLVPRWLGPAKPNLVNGTSGLLRGSTGVEARFTVPGVNQTLRFDYAANPLRLARALLLPDGSAFRAPDRRAAFAWSLGSLF